jgi:outer membrane lipoprotein carrier protein
MSVGAAAERRANALRQVSALPRTLWSVMLGLMLGLLPTAGWADAVAIARVEALLNGTQALSATFTQEVHDANGSVTQSSAGTFWLQKPGRFRWDYTTPKQAIVSDGTRLWFYDADLEQVTVRRQRDVLTQAPAMLLAGKGRVADGFEAESLPPSAGLEWLRLTPRAGAGDFRELQLGFAGRDLRELALLDRLGQRTVIHFSALQRNPVLPAGTFRFQPPPGTDVVGEAP